MNLTQKTLFFLWAPNCNKSEITIVKYANLFLIGGTFLIVNNSKKINFINFGRLHYESAQSCQVDQSVNARKFKVNKTLCTNVLKNGMFIAKAEICFIAAFLMT